MTKLVPNGGEATTSGGGKPSTYAFSDPAYAGDWKVIVDQTGLKGKYLLPPPSYKDAGGSGLIFSVRKYGLELQLGKQQVVGKVVVDHAEKNPTAN